MLFLVLYLGVVDMDLYSYWGFKLDVTPLLYIKTPGDALASVSIFEIVSLLLFFALQYFISIRIYKKYFSPVQLDDSTLGWKILPIGIFLAALLFIPVRGGFGIAPMNIGRVYFHQNNFANHSAINVCWNTIYSFTKKEKLSTQFRYMEEADAGLIFTDIFLQDSTSTQQLIKANSNVVLIILESFSNKIIGSLGGEEKVTPYMNELCKHSVVFENFYANGDRSDKAMAAIYCGFPTLPTISILDFPKKLQSLPYITDAFQANGYETGFYYGGDINFANFRAFFSHESINKMITDEDFPKDIELQKWGIPDGFLFERMQADLAKEEKPFFYSCFTLSSHEPFDVPNDPVFGTDNRDDLSRTSYYYTDRVLGEFLEKAKKSKWWDNTLIVIMADHGSRSPGNTASQVEEKFKIPMIWTGGAILKDTVISKIGSQADFASTLFSQFNFDAGDYVFSKNLLDSEAPSFAFYAFNNGFGYKDEESYVIYDNGFEKLIHTTGNDSDKNLKRGMAFLQNMSDYFTSKQ